MKGPTTLVSSSKGGVPAFSDFRDDVEARKVKHGANMTRPLVGRASRFPTGSGKPDADVAVLEGYDLRRAPAPAGSTPTWREITVERMPLSQQELAKMVEDQCGQDIRLRARLEKLGENKRRHVTQLVRDLNDRERDPNAVWNLAYVCQEKKELGRRRIAGFIETTRPETTCVSVILERTTTTPASKSPGAYVRAYLDHDQGSYDDSYDDEEYFVDGDYYDEEDDHDDDDERYSTHGSRRRRTNLNPSRTPQRSATMPVQVLGSSPRELPIPRPQATQQNMRPLGPGMPPHQQPLPTRGQAETVPHSPKTGPPPQRMSSHGPPHGQGISSQGHTTSHPHGQGGSLPQGHSLPSSHLPNVPPQGQHPQSVPQGQNIPPPPRHGAPPQGQHPQSLPQGQNISQPPRPGVPSQMLPSQGISPKGQNTASPHDRSMPLQGHNMPSSHPPGAPPQMHHPQAMPPKAQDVAQPRGQGQGMPSPAQYPQGMPYQAQNMPHPHEPERGMPLHEHYPQGMPPPAPKGPQPHGQGQGMPSQAQQPQGTPPKAPGMPHPQEQGRGMATQAYSPPRMPSQAQNTPIPHESGRGMPAQAHHPQQNAPDPYGQSQGTPSQAHYSPGMPSQAQNTPHPHEPGRGMPSQAQSSQQNAPPPYGQSQGMPSQVHYPPGMPFQAQNTPHSHEPGRGMPSQPHNPPQNTPHPQGQGQGQGMPSQVHYPPGMPFQAQNTTHPHGQGGQQQQQSMPPPMNHLQGMPPQEQNMSHPRGQGTPAHGPNTPLQRNGASPHDHPVPSPGRSMGSQGQAMHGQGQNSQAYGQPGTPHGQTAPSGGNSTSLHSHTQPIPIVGQGMQPGVGAASRGPASGPHFGVPPQQPGVYQHNDPVGCGRPNHPSGQPQPSQSRGQQGPPPPTSHPGIHRAETDPVIPGHAQFRPSNQSARSHSALKVETWREHASDTEYSGSDQGTEASSAVTNPASYGSVPRSPKTSSHRPRPTALRRHGSQKRHAFREHKRQYSDLQPCRRVDEGSSEEDFYGDEGDDFPDSPREGSPRRRSYGRAADHVPRSGSRRDAHPADYERRRGSPDYGSHPRRRSPGLGRSRPSDRERVRDDDLLEDLMWEKALRRQHEARQREEEEALVTKALEDKAYRRSRRPSLDVYSRERALPFRTQSTRDRRRH